MPMGPGKYDDLTTYVREKTDARAVIVLVLDGNKGSGFSIQVTGGEILTLPILLRHMADEIERRTTPTRQ
jgi:hypothetical protein